MNEGHLPGRPTTKASLAAGLSRFDKREVETGVKDETEHTKDKEIAAQIALDHLKQDPHYYTDLAPVEKKIEKLKNKKNGKTENVKMKISFTTTLVEGGPNKRQRAAARAAKLGAAVDRRIAHELSPQEIARKRDVETAGLKVLPKPQGRSGYHAAAINPTADGMPSPAALKTAHKATARHQANPTTDREQKKIMGTARLSEPAGSPVPTKRIPAPGEAPREPELVMHRPGGEVVAKGVLGDLASKPKPVTAAEPSTMKDTHSVPRAAKELPAGVPKLSAKTTLPKKSMETEQQKFDREKAEVLAKDPDAFKKGKFAPDVPKKAEPRRQSPAPPRPESPDFWDKPL